MRLVGLSCLIAALCAACSSDTGVVISVTRDTTVPPQLDDLLFYVGVDTIAGGAQFADPGTEDKISVSGRDLLTDPYRLMLRPNKFDAQSIMVAVLGEMGGQVVGFGSLAQPIHFNNGETTEWIVTLTGQTPAGFAVGDTGCLTYVDAIGSTVTIGTPSDADCDGYGSDDCDDTDPARNPGATDTCGDGIDQDCDDAIDENVDEDGDGVTTCDGDCNDGDDTVAPGKTEVCDGVDNDCNGYCDDGFDFDFDNYTSCGSQLLDGSCLAYDPATLTDCNESNFNINPGAAEVCDGQDDDCDGVCDNDPALDPDDDGYTDCDSIAGFCGTSSYYYDCSSADGTVHPGANELCDGKDDDCDGSYLEQDACFAIDTATCYLGTRSCDDFSAIWTDSCQPQVGEDSVAPAGFCTAYTTCNNNADPDPYACAFAHGGLTPTDCAFNFEVDTGLQCGAPLAKLPANDTDTSCAWTIVGGQQDQDDLRIGFVPTTNLAATPQATLDVCGAALSVVPESSFLVPSENWFLLKRVGDMSGTTYFAFHVAPQPTQDCGPPKGLVCNGLAAP